MRTLILAAVAVGMTAAPAPAQPPGEAWLSLVFRDAAFRVRVGGGPYTAVRGPAPPAPARYGEPARVLHGGRHHDGFRPPGHAHVFFPAPGVGAGPQTLMSADPDGGNARVVLSAVKWAVEPVPTPDRRGFVVPAGEGARWHLYRVPLDGSPPVRLTRTAGHHPPEFRFRPDGRLLYTPATVEHVRKYPGGASTTHWRGPVVVADADGERVLLSDPVARLPEWSADGRLLAVAAEDKDGLGVLEVHDLETGIARRFPVTAFDAGWRCQFGEARFRPDGRAVAVTFAYGPRVGPLPPPGYSVANFVGVVWLDGRRSRAELIELDEAVQGHVTGHGTFRVDWAAGPR